MNERIRELAEQAGIGLWGNRIIIFDFSADSEEVIQKFAELIVRECCEQLVKEGEAWEQFSRNPPEGQETNTGAALFAAYRLKEDAVSRLEEHFGVEE